MSDSQSFWDHLDELRDILIRVIAALLLCSGQQVRENAQCYIFKCCGGTAEQLQHGEGPSGYGGGQVFCFEFIGICRLDQCGHIGNVGKQCAQNVCGHIHGAAAETCLPVKCGQ